MFQPGDLVFLKYDSIVVTEPGDDTDAIGSLKSYRAGVELVTHSAEAALCVVVAPVILHPHRHTRRDMSKVRILHPKHGVGWVWSGDLNADE